MAIEVVREEVEEEIVEWSGVGGGRSHEGVEEEVKVTGQKRRWGQSLAVEILPTQQGQVLGDLGWPRQAPQIINPVHWLYS